ncbi:MAG: aminoacyl-tRNA hydrolase [Parcubacteria group bacterium]|nr:aminoacyl-tRNA hydrolase [Parcubacteria group bacterium]
MLLVVGLGNPGTEYESTRHNIGFRVIDALAEEHAMELSEEKKFSGMIATRESFILLKPTTFMNRSGETVQIVTSYYKVIPQNIVVIHDDFDLAFGEVRFKEAQDESGDGGHKGVRSVIDRLGTPSTNRIKIGIKNWGENPRPDAERFVLERFTKEEEERLPAIIESALAILREKFLEKK